MTGLLVTALIYGAAQGAAIGLLGMGLVAVNRGSRVINLAHGAMGMLATYIFAAALAHSAHAPAPFRIVIAFLAGIGGSVILAVVWDRLVMHRLVERPVAVRMTATLGLLYVLLSLAQLIFGSNTRQVPSIFGASSHHLGVITLSNDAIGTVLLSLLLAGALGLFYQATHWGMTLRAVADSREIALLRGIRIRTVGAISWSIGGATAALAGIVLAPSVGLNSFILTLLVIQALAAALTGKMQHLLPTLAGGVTIGILTAVTRALLDHWTAGAPPAWVNITAIGDFIALVWTVVAVFRWGKTVPIQRFGVFNAAELLRTPVNAQLRAVLIALTLGAAVIVPAHLNAQALLLVATGAAYTAGILSLVLLTGTAGQLSLMQAGLMGVGGFTAAHVISIWHLPFVLALLAGGCAAIPVAIIAALITQRAGGMLTAIITLGFSQALATLFFNAGINGGATGTVALPRLGTFHNLLDYTWFEIAVVSLLITFVCAMRTRKTGRILLAIRESEEGAQSVAVNVMAARLMVFAIAGFIAGTGGVLYSGINQVASARAFGSFASISLLAGGVVGGLGSTAGAVIGGLLLALGPSVMSNLPVIAKMGDPGDVAGIAMGVLLLVAVTLQPAGLSRPLLRAESRLGARLRGVRAEPYRVGAA